MEQQITPTTHSQSMQACRDAAKQANYHEYGCDATVTAEEDTRPQQPDSLPSANNYLPAMAGPEETSPPETNDTAFQYIPDTTLSQAVAEFEKGMSSMTTLFNQ